MPEGPFCQIGAHKKSSCSDHRFQILSFFKRLAYKPHNNVDLD